VGLINSAEAFLSFKPLPWQEKFLRSTKKSPWAIGGNRSGKTEVGAFKMSTRLLGFCPVTGNQYPVGKYWAVGLDFPQVDQVMRPKIEKYLGTEGRDYEFNKASQLIQMSNGSQLWFKSCDSKRKKFQGADLDGVWFDEEPPFDVFKEAWTRTIDRGGQVWGTMTPVERSAWVYQQIYSVNDPKFDIICMAMTDNSYLPVDEIKAAEELYADPDEVAVRIKGEYRLIIGRPVLHIPSLQKINSMHIKAPLFRGNFNDKGNLEAAANGDLRIWERPKPECQYILGVDTAEGIKGGDYSAVFVIEAVSRDHVASWHGVMDPHPYAEAVRDLARFYNTGLVAIEKPGPGTTVLSRFVHEFEYPNLYKPLQEADRNAGETAGKQNPYGWHTNANNKIIAVNYLRQHVRQLAKIQDHRFYSEGLCWILDDMGRPSTSEGANDDTLMAAAIAYAVAAERFGPVKVNEGAFATNPEDKAAQARNKRTWQEMFSRAQEHADASLERVPAHPDLY
jgi:phage terminase large subunit-like protein